MELKDLVKDAYYYDKSGMLLYGDCLDWMPKIPDKSIDMILCDLPYGTTQCKWDIIIPFDKLWEQYDRIIKDNGAMVFTASQPFTSLFVMSNFKLFKYELIWDKDRPTGFALANKMPMKVHENILIFYKNPPTYNPIKWKGRPNHAITKGNKDTNVISKNRESQPNTKQLSVDLSGDKFPISIIYEKKMGGSITVHPTQKPVPLFEYLIKTYTSENKIVLDNSAGSCTTAVAAKNTNRKWICIEKEEKYCEISKKRIQESKGETV
jgi:site-specific DNA-methyltransferase (adenine-specific)